jgi:hypothetical protein
MRFIPRPILAFPPNDLYSVMVRGSGFTLPIDGEEKPIIGFITTRIVAARDVREAERLVLSTIERDWRRGGHHELGGPASLRVEEVDILTGRFRLRSGCGYIFYQNDDSDDPT